MADVDAVISQVAAAFADVPRPSNAELLHPECADDMDLEVLHDVADWRELRWEQVVAGYSALAFLSPAGFRHFIPAYLIGVLRHPDSSEAVVDSTVWAFHPEMYDDALRPFVRSKWALLDADQRAAVATFLDAMTDHHPDAAAAHAEFSR